MRRGMPFQVGPESTPIPLKILIFITIGTALTAAFFPGSQNLFSLSWNGILQFRFWQFFTYPFMPPAPISFSLFVYLIFNLYLLWVFGSSLIQRSRSSLFFALYFGSALFAGLMALAAMALFHSPLFLAGASAPLFAVLIAWVLLNPDAQLLLFFSIPFKARWLVLGLLAASLLLDLSSGDWVNFFSYLGSALFGYIFSLIAWREASRFPFLRNFERMVFRTLDRTKEKWVRKDRGEPKSYRRSKIYDIRSGEPLLDDDQFMDAMLARISLYGENGLTPEEKKRMQVISAKKNSQKNE